MWLCNVVAQYTSVSYKKGIDLWNITDNIDRIKCKTLVCQFEKQWFEEE